MIPDNVKQKLWDKGLSFASQLAAGTIAGLFVVVPALYYGNAWIMGQVKTTDEVLAASVEDVESLHHNDVTEIRIDQLNDQISELKTDEYWIEKETVADPNNHRAVTRLIEIQAGISAAEAKRSALVSGGSGE